LKNKLEKRALYKRTNEKLDFCYIDAGHSYPYTLSDLTNYFPLVQSGGLISGHDWHLPGVARAINEFIIQNMLKLNVVFPDYWIVKP
jgi:predicted O-methyltransferase YrrM